MYFPSLASIGKNKRVCIDNGWIKSENIIEDPNKNNCSCIERCLTDTLSKLANTQLFGLGKCQKVKSKDGIVIGTE